MSYFQNFMKANKAYVDLHGTYHLPLKPKTKVAIVTCMDSRLHVAQALGLALGDAHILRNAGGHVTEDTIRSLVISQQQLGTREIVVLHHTDCGAQTFTNEDFAVQLSGYGPYDRGYIMTEESNCLDSFIFLQKYLTELCSSCRIVL